MKTAIFLFILTLAACSKPDRPDCQAYLMEANYFQQKADSVKAAWGDSTLARIHRIPVQRNFYDQYQKMAQENKQKYFDCMR